MTAKRQTRRTATSRRVREPGAEYGPGRGKIVLYRAPDGTVSLDVRLERETIWLDAHQMALLFGRDRSVILRHVRNIYDTNELERSSTCAKNAQVAADGKTRKMDIYNLDVIIGIGYRVNSRRGTQFRIWATQVLRDHILKGYTVNERRLKELNRAVRLIADVARRRDLSGDEASALLRVVGEYSFALDLLDDYDHQRVKTAAAPLAEAEPISLEEARRAVETLRTKYDAFDLFGREKDDSLAGALAAVMQSAGGREAYPSIEEKAAHLLYFLVKNHPFVDGNKRIAAALFLRFLDKNGALILPTGERRVENAALVAITLLIAESRPQEKDILTRVITHLLAGRK